MLGPLIVAVAGASGRIGAPAAAELERSGHTVRRLHRDSASHPVDLATGAGLERALDGVDVVIHAQNGPPRRPGPVLLDGSRRLLEAAPTAHHVLISIVGIDVLAPHVRYYGAKLEQEAAIRAAPDHSILRTTQFHEFVGAPLLRLARLRIALRSPIPLAPIAAAEAAAGLVRVSVGTPTGAIRTLAGPEALSVSQLCPGPGVPVPLPLPPTLRRLLLAGALAPAAPDARGVRRYADWLAEATGRPWRPLPPRASAARGS